MSKRMIRVLAVLVVCFGLSGLFSGRVFADGVDWNTIKSKAAFEGVYNCLTQGAYSANWQTSQGEDGFLIADGERESVKLPYGKTDANDNNAECDEIMIGFDKDKKNDIDGDKLNEGLIGLGVFETKPENAENMAKFFAGEDLKGSGGLGYSAKGDPERVISEGNIPNKKIEVEIKRKLPCETRTLRFPTSVGKKTSDNKTIYTFASDDEDIDVPNSTDLVRTYDFCGDTVVVEWKSGWYEISQQNSNDSLIIGPDGNESEKDYFGDANGGDNFSIKVTANPIGESGKNVYGNYGLKIDLEDRGIRKFMWGINKNNQIGYSVGTYTKYSDLALTPQEIYDLYTYYIKSVYNVQVICDDYQYFNDYKDDSGYKEINWAKDKTCLAYVDGVEEPKDVYGVNDNGHFTETMTLDKVIEGLKKIDLSKLERVATTGALDDGTIGGNTSNPETEKTTCLNSGAASSLGWILCPILDFLSNAANAAYSNTIAPALIVEPTLFSGDNADKSTREAWNVFQSMANILFIILLLVVIFSQLTGVGIDNYGIKKVLPKLIIAAILINLSYFICVLLVDLSNIVGNGLYNMMNNLGGFTPPTTIEGISIAAQVGSTIMWSPAILGALAVGIWPILSSGGGAAILLMLLTGALSVVVAIFFLFLLLAARKAAIVVLIVISPLAFACFILPNTKKYFDRWIKLAWGLLLVFPICGLLVGGGNFVSKLLLVASGSRGGIMMAITSMVVGIAPVFFIPTLLKGSLNAVGNIGAKISGVGTKYGGKLVGSTDKTIKGSDAYRRINNQIGMRLPFRRVRANAAKDEGARIAEQESMRRLSNRSGMETRLASIRSAAESKALDQETSERLSLMQSSGSGGGIMVGGRRVSYTLPNMAKRMEELEELARTQELNSDQQLELAALARGMANEKGGASQIGAIVRRAEATVTDENGNRSRVANSNFMNALGRIYTQDSTVRSKMNAKDSGASIYTEQFMSGGERAHNLTFSGYRDYEHTPVQQRNADGSLMYVNGNAVYEGQKRDANGDYMYDNQNRAIFEGQRRNANGEYMYDGNDNPLLEKEYGGQLAKRVKSHEAGLQQGGAAFDEYLESLGREDLQDIIENQELLQSLDSDDRDKVRRKAATFGISMIYTRSSDSQGNGSNGGGSNGGIVTGSAAESMFRDRFRGGN
ncbi:hypothetical protein J6S37_01395, partial [Candidatus Saccharibacteria bacterium]|nr:hypothetical protein [Candidatus Saccharibacteria bacterium]